MTRPIVLTSEDACPECKGFNLSMQTNPVHDPVHHYECHDCGYSWDVSPKRGIVLTEEEREALRRSAKYLKERGEYLSNGKMKSDAITLETLLARSGGEGGNEPSTQGGGE